MSQSQIRKIAVVGNIAGGKTRLTRRLSFIHSIPATHIDQLQFLPGLLMRPLPETRALLAEVTTATSWLIDGYGPLDLIEKRFHAADRVVFIDFPVWRHFWWLTRRQIQNLWSRREELPEGCDERNWKHTRKLYRTLWQMHTKMRPELLRIFQREHFRPKVIHITTLKEYHQLCREGLPV